MTQININKIRVKAFRQLIKLLDVMREEWTNECIERTATNNEYNKPETFQEFIRRSKVSRLNRRGHGIEGLFAKVLGTEYAYARTTYDYLNTLKLIANLLDK